ncbi:RNA polymerase sigma factor SigM [Nocardia sp. NBC_00416]|uniref:RNA polymerase sigma factor SigM n=1 Tax=Nocardia sp. NBC_00416 TaxID=2975991 RepID=UPI002E2360CB
MSSELNAGGRAGTGTAGTGESQPDATSDIDLLRAHADGAPHAFAELIRRHNDHLWQTAARVCYTPEDAADALQEALLSAHRNAGSFRAESGVRTWLHRIVVNACLDRIRRNRARPALFLPPEVWPEISDNSDDYGRVDISIVLERALFQLPPDQRAAVVAVDVEGYSVADAAEMLGVPVGTVKSRCARARQRLKTELDSLYAEGNQM